MQHCYLFNCLLLSNVPKLTVTSSNEDDINIHENKNNAANVRSRDDFFHFTSVGNHRDELQHKFLHFNNTAILTYVFSQTFNIHLSDQFK